jgi:hypothetical protein
LQIVKRVFEWPHDLPLPTCLAPAKKQAAKKKAARRKGAQR